MVITTIEHSEMSAEDNDKVIAEYDKIQSRLTEFTNGNVFKMLAGRLHYIRKSPQELIVMLDITPKLPNTAIIGLGVVGLVLLFSASWQWYLFSLPFFIVGLAHTDYFYYYPLTWKLERIGYKGKVKRLTSQEALSFILNQDGPTGNI